MRRFLAAVLCLLTAQQVEAGSASFVREDVVADKRVCYYEFDGFTYHYVMPKGLLTKTRCAPGLETPFELRLEGWAVLILDEVEVHDFPNRLCYYGASMGRLAIKTQSRQQVCDWVAMAPSSATPSGIADLFRDSTIPNTQTRLCLYKPSAARAPTHYRLLSVYSRCANSLPVS